MSNKKTCSARIPGKQSTPGSDKISRLETSLAAACILLALGCVSHRPVTLPIGEWTGQGTFVYELWNGTDGNQSIHRDYPTRLCLTKSMIDGRPAIELEVVSRRGELPELDKQTHMRLSLVEAKRPSNRTVLYRVAGPIFDPKPEDRPRFEPDAPPVGASCIRVGGATILQITYMDGFMDIYRFRGKGLTKAGTLTFQDGCVHWVESLVQRKPADLLSGRPPFNHLAGS